MCASAAATAFSLVNNNPSFPRCSGDKFIIKFNPPITYLTHRSPRNTRVRFSATIAQSQKSFEVSWLFPDQTVRDDDFGGWAIVDTPIPKKKKGFPTFWILGIGTSFAVLLAAIAHFSLAKKGLKLRFGSPLHVLHDIILSPPVHKVNEMKNVDSDASNGDSVVSEASKVDLADSVSEPITSEKHHPRIISVPLDSTQQEALSTLKTLKIIENDVKADALCSRREYARWLVQANSLLERNSKRRVVPAVALSGSIVAAYEDVGVGDPDFEPIQALAEAGIIFSKLSGNYSLDRHGDIKFSPDSFLSRHDLIDWRAQQEYDFDSAGTEKITKAKLVLMDMREISTDASPGLFMDTLAGESSLLRRVFGQIRRFQPHNPATKAQAAVALASGKMADAMHNELLRIEAEESSRQAAKKEIKKELLDRGEIQRYWDEKIEEERTHWPRAKQLYLAALDALEEEKIVQESTFAEYLKEKAALDCQKQLLNGLKVETSEMADRLAVERAEQIAEEEAIQIVSHDLQIKQEGILDAKSLLEAEIEALRILRSWIEDEARKSQARSKVLEEVGRRWRWDAQY
ncbi:hypothetical protein Ancab_018584 [Ancistrocladus abbreviatus]